MSPRELIARGLRLGLSILIVADVVVLYLFVLSRGALLR